MLTRLELFLRRTLLSPSEVAKRAGYTRQHFRRMRLGDTDPTRVGVVAVTKVCRRLSGEPVRPESLFERASQFLRTNAQRLSSVHRSDRRAVAAILADGADAEFVQRIDATGIASETAVRHLLTAATTLLDREPTAAARIAAAARAMAARLESSPSELALALQAHALKVCANALRHLGTYEAALAALRDCGALFSAARYCAIEAGQVEYTRASILFKMERWDDALSAATAAREAYAQIADVRRVARAELLEANVLFERGDLESARTTWLRLRKVFATLKDNDGLARVWLNLGVCETRRFHSKEARHWLTRAAAAFHALGSRTEVARTVWNYGWYLATFSEPVRALRVLRRARRTFLALSMWVDAACVGLDMTEAMIEVGTPDNILTAHAQDVASTFVRAGLEVSLAYALDQLRQITRAADRRKIVRTVRAAVRDAASGCNNTAPLFGPEAGIDGPEPPEPVNDTPNR